MTPTEALEAALREQALTQNAQGSSIASALSERVGQLDSTRGTSTRPGRLQQLQDLRAVLFGGIDSYGNPQVGFYV